MPLNSERRYVLRRRIPEGTLITRKALIKSGLTRHAIDNFLKSKQLKAYAQGVYGWPESILSWQGIVYSLQSMFNDFTVGGLTALELQGLAHYLPLSDKKTIHLYGRTPLPGWALTLSPDIKFVRHNKKELLGRHSVIHDVNEPDKASLEQFTERYAWKDNTLPLILSVPERAYLELLMNVPEAVSFEHADQIMQGLTSLSPRKLQILLELCNNIKVRRLFLWFAERHSYSWFKRLDLEKITLGSGKRVIAKGGKLDTKYNITVPENL